MGNSDQAPNVTKNQGKAKLVNRTMSFLQQETGTTTSGSRWKPLGAESVVALNIQVEATGVTKEVLCYVLDSNKSLWKGELTYCGVVLNTNCLVELGFKITNSDGFVVESGTNDNKGETSSPKSH